MKINHFNGQSIAVKRQSNQNSWLPQTCPYTTSSSSSLEFARIAIKFGFISWIVLCELTEIGRHIEDVRRRKQHVDVGRDCSGCHQQREQPSGNFNFKFAAPLQPEASVNFKFSGYGWKSLKQPCPSRFTTVGLVFVFAARQEEYIVVNSL
ncbi:hypothetical protein PV327_003793 [Microctonus hyperodae]|uniref:Uncharacterized protein n=1 Tax=Microctonus hyperodae TaxID=165561 RepID=A0AA39G4P8_MICHY|nr:hypothetical protein PV327_003793 [Microctonus hyperodae]